MSTEKLIAAYVTLMLIVMGVLVLYSEHRRRRFRPPAGTDHIFRCKKCSLVYTDDDDVDRSRCPQCGLLNEEVKF